MSLPSEPKKRKVEKEFVSLQGALEHCRQEGHSNSSFDKASLLKWLGKSASHIFSVLTSHVVHGPKVQAFTVPWEFRDFTIHRSGEGYVDAILNVNEVAVDGSNLAMIQLLENGRQRGFDHSYFQVAEPSWMIGFKSVMTETVPLSDKDEDEEKEATRVYTYEAQTTCYTSANDLLKILSLDYVQVEDFKAIAMAVSSAAKSGNQIDVQELATPDKLALQLSSALTTSAMSSLVQTLYASHLKTANLQDKINAFIAHPSPRLASMIDLKAPTRLALVHTSNKSPVTSVPIGSLSPEDDIILSNVAISQEFYQQVIVARDVQVVRNAGKLLVKNRDKLRPLKVVDTMKVKDYLRILQAIEKANKASGQSTEIIVGEPAKLDATGVAAFFQK